MKLLGEKELKPDETNNRAEHIRQRLHSRANALENVLDVKKMTSKQNLQERLRKKKKGAFHASGGGEKKIDGKDNSVFHRKHSAKHNEVVYEVDSSSLNLDAYANEEHLFEEVSSDDESH